MNNFTESFQTNYQQISYETHFLDLSKRFNIHHQNDLNIFIHFLTTPLGVLGFISLIRILTNSSTIGVAISLFYIMTLLPTVSSGVLFGTALMTFIIVISSRKLQLGLWKSLSCIVLGYLLQDLSHFLTRESTFQSTYSDGGHIDFRNVENWLSLFIDHTYYLIPLIVNLVIHKLLVGKSLDFVNGSIPPNVINVYNYSIVIIPLFIWALGSYCLDSKNGFCFFPGAYYTSRVLTCNIVTEDEESRKADLKKIRNWVLEKMPSKTTSSHWWVKDLESTVRDSFDRCAKSSIIFKMFRNLFDERHYCLDIVHGMNEIYVSGPSRADENFNSDQIFYSKHVDGPWGFIPFVSVFRCIVGMDRNMSTYTHFPMKPVSKNATEGEVVAFDFNREVHYITKDESKEEISDEFRVVLKLHYCLYPRVLAPLGWLMHSINVAYNKTFRALFLKTINPSTLYEHFLAWNVIVNTSLFNNVETFIGQRNVIYLSLAFCVSYITGNYFLFLTLTSFVHYIRYISTYYYRSEIDYGSFKRDVLMFKTLALAQLFLIYLFPEFMAVNLIGCDPVAFKFDVISLIMIVSGYALSILATNALGLDRTYFGVELGFYEFKLINQFPYGYIPHPMILSQVWALLGMFKASHIRTMIPFIIPVHISLYLLHMLQEHFDIYQKPIPSKKIKIN